VRGKYCSPRHCLPFTIHILIFFFNLVMKVFFSLLNLVILWPNWLLICSDLLKKDMIERWTTKVEKEWKNSSTFKVCVKSSFWSLYFLFSFLLALLVFKILIWPRTLFFLFFSLERGERNSLNFDNRKRKSRLTPI